ncbi:MAG TPA: hypothetical protein VJ909_09930, partial [Prolixibacteraceae bacterium]|nr:hypothetical protein [Prolixibacteraceae bacterium]
MKFDYTNIDLPVVSLLPELKERMLSENTLLVNAPPGAGKSTIIPIAMLDESWLGKQKIIM